MKTDWDLIIEEATEYQPKVVQDIRSFNLFVIVPQQCIFTKRELTGSSFLLLLEHKRRTLALLVEKNYYVKNHRRIQSFLEIHQGHFNEPMIVNVVQSVPNFANYRPWLTPQIKFVQGSLKDVDSSKSTTSDRTRYAGREHIDPDFMEIAQEKTEKRIAQLDHKPTADEAFKIFDELQVALPARAEQLKLEAHK